LEGGTTVITKTETYDNRISEYTSVVDCLLGNALSLISNTKKKMF
jgi:hypothetical protein